MWSALNTQPALTPPSTGFTQVSHLDHARGAAILRAFDQEGSERPVGQVFDQIGNVASAAVDAIAGWLGKKK